MNATNCPPGAFEAELVDPGLVEISLILSDDSSGVSWVKASGLLSYASFLTLA